MSANRLFHTATSLPDGKVLATGADGLGGAEIYDPVSGTWASTGKMSTDRYRHSATLLLDGRVLIAGGYDDGTDDLASAELFDPETGAFTASATLPKDSYVTVTARTGDGTQVAHGYVALDPTPLICRFCTVPRP